MFWLCTLFDPILDFLDVNMIMVFLSNTFTFASTYLDGVNAYLYGE